MKWLPWLTFRHCAISVSLVAAHPVSADLPSFAPQWSRRLCELLTGLGESEEELSLPPAMPGVQR
jgi:hypothetical protein